MRITEQQKAVLQVLADMGLSSAALVAPNVLKILHGKGNGVLMEGVHNYLAKQININNFYFAKYEQGGNGVTIVEFK